MLKTLCGLGLTACVLVAQDKAAAPACDLVPGWTESGPVRTYTADNLFEYMDGNAEGYLRYHFQQMRGVTCHRGDTTFVIDLSEMENSEFAYGLFTTNRDLREPEYAVGMGGQIVPRRLIFAKGKYYIEIAANPEGDYTAALKTWAAALAKAVPGGTSIPAVVSWFQKDKLESLRLAPESVLGLRVLKRGYVAQYDYGKAFVVLEESPASAGAVIGQLKARFGSTTPVKLSDEAFQVTDRYLGRLCVFRKGRYIAGYAISAEDADPVALSTALAGKIQ
ncbi:MAG: DUF6599 family protein [Bryobacteraceae bacterium]